MQAQHRMLLGERHLDVRVETVFNLIEQPFVVKVFAKDVDGAIFPVGIPISLSLVDKTEKTFPVGALSSGSITVLPIRTGLTNGQGEFQIVVGERADLNGLVCIRATSGTEWRGDSSFFMLAIHSIQVVEEPSQLFYKDQGGRSARLTVGVALKTHSQINPPPLPLKLSLLYDSGVEVNDQTILVPIGAATVTAGEGLVSQVSFLITEVSRNHRGQKFRIRLSADTDSMPDMKAVAPAFTAAIEVRSKPKDGAKKKSGAHRHRETRSATPTLFEPLPVPQLLEKVETHLRNKEWETLPCGETSVRVCRSCGSVDTGGTDASGGGQHDAACPLYELLHQLHLHTQPEDERVQAGGEGPQTRAGKRRRKPSVMTGPPQPSPPAARIKMQETTDEGYHHHNYLSLRDESIGGRTRAPAEGGGSMMSAPLQVPHMLRSQYHHTMAGGGHYAGLGNSDTCAHTQNTHAHNTHAHPQQAYAQYRAPRPASSSCTSDADDEEDHALNMEGAWMEG